jgi:signal transduction histidine kinase/sugar phosphate isomerase/epimerase
MKIGFRTNIWGHRIDDLEHALALIAGARFQGVEICQSPRTLLDLDIDIEQLMKMLKEKGLKLAGLSGGSLGERMTYCRENRPDYLFTDDWYPGQSEEICRRHFTLALHPHAFKRVRRLDQALNLLDQHEGQLKLLPDLAHLTIVGDDPVQAIHRIGSARLAGVHMRDWNRRFGRSSHLYARGFTRLGDGDVNLKPALKALKDIGFDGWLIAEQGGLWPDPYESIWQCAEELSKIDLLPPPESRRFPLQRPIEKFPPPRTCETETEFRVLRSIQKAGAESPKLGYQRIAKAFSDLGKCDLVTVWSCSTMHDSMSLLAMTPDTSTIRNVVLNSVDQRISEVLSGIAVSRQSVTHFNLEEREPGRKYDRPYAAFGCPELLDLLKLKSMTTIPVFNPLNQGHLRLIINQFHKDPFLKVSDDDLARLAADVALAVDSILDRHCSFAVASANYIAESAVSVKEYLKSLVQLISEFIPCEGISIFLVNDLGNRLELAETTGVVWNVPTEDQYYRKGEGMTGTVWERNEPIMASDARKHPSHKGKASECYSLPRDSCLLAPLSDSRGEAIGVIRLQNKRAGDWGGFNTFSDNDLAVVDAIGRAAAPHIRMLTGEERRSRVMRRVTHELKTPLVAVRAAAEMMKDELARREISVANFFEYDYLNDIWSWSELMRRVLGNAEFFRFSETGIPIQSAPTLLMRDVIAPSVRQVAPILHGRKFSSDRIRYGRFDTVPKLWIDKNLFQQVIFNLLANSIKYAYRDPMAFNIIIDGLRRHNHYVIKFQDTGPGIPKDMAEVIFEEGIRGSNANENNVAGQGIGLWVVRQIVEAHGGSVEVTNLSLPTEFSIFLPLSLATRPQK